MKKQLTRVVLISLATLLFTIASLAHTKGDFGVCGSAADPAVFRPSDQTIYYLSTCSGTYSALSNIGQNSGDQWLPFNNGGSSDVFADFSSFNTRWNLYDRFGALIDSDQGAWNVGGTAFAGDVYGTGVDASITYYQGVWKVYPNPQTDPSITYTYYWGDPSHFDKPLVGDFNNDGMADLAFYRQSDWTWHVYHIYSGTSEVLPDFPHGTAFANVKVFSGNVRGTGDELCRVFIVPKPGTDTWYCMDHTGYQLRVLEWGDDGDIPVVGDFRNLGREQLTLFNPATGVWKAGDVFLGNHADFTFGGDGDIPIQAGRIH